MADHGRQSNDVYVSIDDDPGMEVAPQHELVVDNLSDHDKNVLEESSQEIESTGMTNKVSAPVEPEVSPEQRAMNIAQILSEDELQLINQHTLIFEFEPFSKLEIKMRELTESLVDENIAQLVVSHVRQAIHDSVIPIHDLSKSANSEAGLNARIASLGLLKENMERELGSLLTKLEREEVPDIGNLSRSLFSIIDSDQKALQEKTKKLVPMSVGRVLFESLRNAVAPPEPGSQLIGNSRLHRNKELTGALDNLKMVAEELKQNAGNIEWERGQGKASITAVGDLSKQIDGLTKGVEDQVDSLALRKGLGNVKTLLTEAGDASKDPDHKSKLDEVKNQMSEFIKMLTDALSNLFSKFSTPAAHKPT